MNTKFKSFVCRFDHTKNTPQKSIVRWFLTCFISYSIIFLVALIPLVSYCQRVVTELEIQKSTQKMDSGITMLENTVTGIVSASQSMSKDIRFLPFFQKEPDYSSISVSVCNQMKDYFDGLMFPLALVSDSALQFSDNVAITPSSSIFNERTGYYPLHFKVDGLNYEAWEDMLAENGTGFLPVQRVTVSAMTYDALIFSLPWTRNAYIYACMDIADIKKALIEKSDLETYYLTLTDRDGQCLYTDLPEELSEVRSFTQATSAGNLVVTVHIPESALTVRMRPLYYFLGLYLAVCAVVFIVAVSASSRVSSRPILNIINAMDEHSDSPDHSYNETSARRRWMPFHYGFHYIQNKVQSYKNDLDTYRSMIDTQGKVLQARFLEKALHGSLAVDRDYEEFLSYFPDFPESFCLIQLGLLEEEGNGNRYSDALSLIQIYIQDALPDTYCQQLNNAELLLIVDEASLDEHVHILNYLIDNINREEPCYHAWGIISKCYCHPKSIPSAYWQIQDLRSRVSLESLPKLYVVSDYSYSGKSGFQMADALGLHSAITYGNKEVALLKLQSYFDSLHANNRSVFEMLRSILLCIKHDHAVQTLDIDIPSYHSQLNMYAELEKAISDFCDVFQTLKDKSETASFADQVKEYIDFHFIEDDLCHSKIAEHFQCSASKIHKAFTKEFDITVSNYIEKKRMDMANELLEQGEHTIVEIAKKCGYTSDTTFYRAYRRVFGYAPKSGK